ncbi:MAG: MmcB family DNA repair protein [Deltaproteobacteria bacterium]|nr:MmcB family DNA repair protein [Deltaproteobacteria bacterium]
MAKITAKNLLELLLARHSADVAVPECKNGPTWTAVRQQHRRMDLWVMKRSWANPLSICYEIKVTRSDFLGDQKWQAYLPFCNELMFVCPPGVIDKQEVPEQAGLIVCSKNGARLFNRKKAPYRDIELPESLYRYILMSRSRVDSELNIDSGSGDKTERWRVWMRLKDEKKELGWNVSKKIRQILEQQVYQVEVKQNILEKEIENLKELRTLALALGFTEDQLCTRSWDFKRTAEELLTGDRDVKVLLGSMNSLENNLIAVKQKLGEYLDGAPKFE